MNHYLMQWHTGDPKRSILQFMESDGGGSVKFTVSYTDESGTKFSNDFTIKGGMIN